MSSPERDRLFANEYEFVRWMVTLLQAHPDFSDVAVDQRIQDKTAPLGKVMRPDIMARHRRSGTMIIECRN